MARTDLWSKSKGTLTFATLVGTPRRFRLTNQKSDGSGNTWRPWDSVAVDAQHISAAIYVAFGGTEASATLASGVQDDLVTSFRIQGRTRELFAMSATSISILTPTAATNVFVELFKY